MIPGEHLVRECRLATRGVSGFSPGQPSGLRSGDPTHPEVVQRSQLPLHAERTEGTHRNTEIVNELSISNSQLFWVVKDGLIQLQS